MDQFKKDCTNIVTKLREINNLNLQRKAAIEAKKSTAAVL